MNKFSFAGMSLVGALPGAFLCYLLVMMFINNAENAQGVMLGVAGITLIAAACVALMPVLILIFAPGVPTAPRAAKPAKEAKAKPVKQKPAKKGKGKKGQAAALMAGDDDLDPTIDDLGGESEGFVAVDMSEDEDNLDDFVDIGEYDEDEEFK